MVAGFFDGSFNASNTSYCRTSAIQFEETVQNMTLSIANDSLERSVFYGTNTLRYFHPAAFHCYYAGKETY